MGPVEFRAAHRADAEALQFGVAVAFDGYRAFAPPGWTPHGVARLFTPEPHVRARRFYERRGWEPAGADELPDFGMPLLAYRLRVG